MSSSSSNTNNNSRRSGRNNSNSNRQPPPQAQHGANGLQQQQQESRPLRRSASKRMQGRRQESLSSMIERTSQHHRVQQHQQQQQVYARHRQAHMRRADQMYRSNSGRRRDVTRDGVPHPPATIMGAGSSAVSNAGTLSLSDGSASLDMANIFYGENTTVDGGTRNNGSPNSSFPNSSYNNTNTNTNNNDKDQRLHFQQQYQQQQQQRNDQFRDEHDDDFSFNDDSKASSDNENNNNKNTIASEETQNIGRLRWIVFGLLFATTVLVSFVVYYNTQREETNQFIRSFDIESLHIQQAINQNIQSSVQKLQQFRSLYVLSNDNNGYGNDQSKWPFVMLPNFAYHIQQLQSTFSLISVLPIIKSSIERQEWQRYAYQTARDTFPKENIFESVSSYESSTKNDDSNNNRRRQEEYDVDKSIGDGNTDDEQQSQTTTTALPTSAPTPLQGQQPNLVPTKDSITKPPSSSGATTLSPTGSPIIQQQPGQPAVFQNGLATTLYRMEPNRSQSNDNDSNNANENVSNNNNNEASRPIVELDNLETYLPMWQTVPMIQGLYQYNVPSDPVYTNELAQSLKHQTTIIGQTNVNEMDLLSQAIVLSYSKTNTNTNNDMATAPRLSIVVPMFEELPIPSTNKMVGLLLGIIHWNQLISTKELHPSTQILMVLEMGQCGDVNDDMTDNNDGDRSSSSQQMSFRISPTSVEYLGQGDQHNTKFNNRRKTIRLDENDDKDDNAKNQFMCSYSVHLYPTQHMKDEYTSNLPIIYTTAVIFTFIFTVGVFILYDILVERRQRLVMEKAVQSSAVVSSLFPAVVRDRLFPGRDLEVNVSAKRRLKSFLDDATSSQTGGAGGAGGGTVSKSSASRRKMDDDTKPIADLFPYTTVLFADISGFTAWSSVREPSQVFTLLETIYGAFDRIARKRTVFKVETIGDCYVAVTGLPDPQDDHAVIMAKFAYECMCKMEDLVEKLEVKLGPDTGDLSMRLGMHSGPVTAGVLRGEKSRFQLFGDTVNTAARMESTGKAGKIQCSQRTAELLIAANKTHWICPRDEIVQAKGKGKIQTYWINLSRAIDSPLGDSMASFGSFGSSNYSKRSFATSVRDMSRSLVWGENNQSNFQELAEKSVEHHKHQRLIDWNVEILSKLLRQIVARRRETKTKTSGSFRMSKRIGLSHPIHEVSEAIVMPEFDPKGLRSSVNPDSIDLGYAVQFQLKKYITEIACHYRDGNPFHNFEHASHVTMSANKLLKRVVAPDDVYDRKQSMRKIASNLHNYTYGITSDPLTQFAIVFSALIHDVDHHGVSNMQLIKENSEAAVKYGEKSVAEQNSVDISWELLLRDDYKDLQKCIYANNDREFRRFRNLVVNSVIATDIFDKDLKSFRNARWDKAFHQGNNDTNLMATIVIEHIIQAADVSHTMQHWHIYQKWNERLFCEMYSAYRSGRGGEKDPSKGWYKGELWFYDNYVIPLAKKLKECNVFGVASAECLTYAESNRKEWEIKGERIVDKMVKAYHSGQSLNQISFQMQDSEHLSATSVS